MITEKEKSNALELKIIAKDLQVEILKHIAFVASAALVLLTALTPVSEHSSFLFCSTLLLLLLSILTGTIALYFSVFQYRRMSKDYAARLENKYLKGNLKQESTFLPYNGMYRFLEAVSVFSFLVALGCLVWYSFVK